jgi:hypothetical protein
MIYAKFGQVGTAYANVAIEMCNMVPVGADPTHYTLVPDDSMGKTIILDNGVVRALTEEEELAKLAATQKEGLRRTMRAKRDSLLDAADKLSQADRWESYSASTKTAITAYKQALRDITKVPGFPVLLPENWPTEPTV